ncbi:MAG: cation-transporting P-type ATPase [Opitutales bacterium]
MQAKSDQISSKNDAAAVSAWHAETAESVLQALDTTDKGLSGESIRSRLERYGPNSLPRAHKQSALLRFLLQFHNVLIYILILAAFVTAAMQHWIDTAVIFTVVFVNAVIGFIQEGKAEQALDAIRNMLSLKALVLRDGDRQEIDADQLVPGDLVYLESGDKVPADLRLLRVKNLKIEESPLTGESAPVEKSTAGIEASSSLGDRTNMAFSGTMVTSGRGTGVVTATGAHTELGKINEMMHEVQSVQTPLIRQMNHFGKVLSGAIVGLAFAFFLIGYFFRNYPLPELLLAIIGLAVAAIPEGLPAIMTITLALGVQRMARKKAIIRRLPSVETLGSVTVICSDKTGTLTRNEMTAQTIELCGQRYRVSGSGYRPEGVITDEAGKEVSPADVSGLRELITGIDLCNDATLYENDGQWLVRGDPTEGGLRTLARKAFREVASDDRLDAIPFESEHKYMATLNQLTDSEGNEVRTIWVKGAPEAILERCEEQWTAEGTEPLDQDHWHATIEAIAEKGERVLAVACKAAPTSMNKVDHGDIKEGLVLLGLIGMMDPPRPEAIQAVADCRSAGIRVKMITGDHAKTASAIARELGLKVWDKPLIGRDLDQMDAQELARAADECDVFARTSPENKLRLVEALQASGQVTAMTGDGVNDAPALKRADVGIAMGIKGTEVTKDASSMVLADDNFATIVAAVREGRTIYDNLRKAILFILPTNGAQALVIMAAILFGMEAMPITPVQILWVNMVTAVTLALAFTFEPAEAGVMRRPPRAPGSGILNRHFFWRICFVSTLIASFSIVFYRQILEEGASQQLATTMAVNTLVGGQIFYLFNCRSLRDSIFTQGWFSNRIAWLTIGLLVVFQGLFTYAGFMHTLMGTEGLPAKAWLSILGAGVTVMVFVELEKWVLRRLESRSSK